MWGRGLKVVSLGGGGGWCVGAYGQSHEQPDGLTYELADTGDKVGESQAEIACAGPWGVLSGVRPPG